jgi:hypothetical protein
VIGFDLYDVAAVMRTNRVWRCVLVPATSDVIRERMSAVCTKPNSAAVWIAFESGASFRLVAMDSGASQVAKRIGTAADFIVSHAVSGTLDDETLNAAVFIARMPTG